MNEVRFSNSPLEIVKNLIKAGETKASMKLEKMFWLGILAGFFISCGASASSVAIHTFKDIAIAKFVAGAIFPVGFIMVVLIGGELFTGDCMMVMGWLNKKYSVFAIIKVLFYVFLFNLIGSVVFAYLVYLSGQFNFTDGLLGAFTIKIALAKVNIPFGTAFVSGILCNIFVCFAVLAAGSAKEIGGKVFAAFFPIMAFVVSGYEHCVANMYYIPAGIFAMGNEKYVAKAMSEYGFSSEQLSTLNWGSFLIHNEIPATLGNIVGGAVFVGALMFMIHRRDLTEKS